MQTSVTVDVSKRIRVYHDLTQSENRLSGEINIKSIRALDEQIRGHETAIAKLKRTRNSLLNVYKIPPEVLGKIFGWNVTFKNDFGGLQEITTSSSSATTGSRLPFVLQSFGVSGATLPKIGRDGIAVLGPLRSTWSWIIRIMTTMVHSTFP